MKTGGSQESQLIVEPY